MAAVLALTAVGLSLVFGVMRVVNVAHGEFFMLGAVSPGPSPASSPACPRSASSRPSSSAPSSSARSPSCSTGSSCAGSTTSPRRRSSRRSASATCCSRARSASTAPRRARWPRRSTGSIQLPVVRLFRLQARGDRFAALAPRRRLALLARSRIGLVMRATQWDRETATAFGIDVDRVYAGVFGLGAGARRGRRRPDRADPAGALPDGRRPAAALLHRRHHRRARRRCAAPSSPALLIGLSRRHRLGLLLADAREDPRDAPRRAGPRLPPPGPLRAGARRDERRRPGTAR